MNLVVHAYDVSIQMPVDLIFSPRLTAKFLSSLATIFEIYEMVFPFYPNLYDKLNDTNILIGSFKTS